MASKKKGKLVETAKVTETVPIPPSKTEKTEKVGDVVVPEKSKGPTPEQVLEAMKTIKGDVTSTALKDHFKLDKETGRDRIRRVMKQLQKDGKVVIAEKEGAKRKQFVYKLVE